MQPGPASASARQHHSLRTTAARHFARVRPGPALASAAQQHRRRRGIARHPSPGGVAHGRARKGPEGGVGALAASVQQQQQRAPACSFADRLPGRGWRQEGLFAGARRRPSAAAGFPRSHLAVRRPRERPGRPGTIAGQGAPVAPALRARAAAARRPDGGERGGAAEKHQRRPRVPPREEQRRGCVGTAKGESAFVCETAAHGPAHVQHL